MITVYLTAERITYGTDSLIQLMIEHSSNLIRLFQVERLIVNDGQYLGGKEYTFIALFKEPKTVGQFVAFINQWGTSWGPGSGGTGAGGFARIQSYIEDVELDVTKIDWRDVSENLRIDIESTTYLEVSRAWAEYITYYQLPPILTQSGKLYPTNKNWKNRDHRQGIPN